MKGGEGVLDFEMVFRENNQFVFRFLMKLCGDVSLAEELTQETFFRAYMNISALRNEERVAVWLCQIAKNTYFAWFNEQKRKQPISQPISANSTPDLAELFEGTEYPWEMLPRIKEHIATLLRDTLVIPERDYNGYNYTFVKGTDCCPFACTLLSCRVQDCIKNIAALRVFLCKDVSCDLNEI